jgi:hypothetical protein
MIQSLATYVQRRCFSFKLDTILKNICFFLRQIVEVLAVFPI